MAQTVKFRRITFKNPYKSIGRAFERDAKKLPEREAVFTWRRARSIMKKAPKKPKSLYGNRQAYRKGKNRHGQTHFYRKGLYSRPGHPPFYHSDNPKAYNLRKIEFGRVTPMIPHARGGGDVYAWRVGPMYKPTKNVIPVPALHEYGGSVQLKVPPHMIEHKGLQVRIGSVDRTGQVRAYYPPRPYMAPASKEARESSQRKSPHSLRKITKLGGWKGRRIY